jgi:hypothetical protein
LYWPTNDATLGCTLRLAFTDEKAAISPKSITAFMAGKALLVPLPANSSDDNVV